MLLYGWNDYVDYETDRLNPRKGSFLFGARGSMEQLRKLPVMIALVQAPFVIAFCYLRGRHMLLWFAGTVAAAAIYNWPRWGFKSRPPLEILNQAMHSHVFGEIMDLEPDRDSGRSTTAVVIGRVPAKLLISALLAAECALVTFFFHDLTLALFLLASAVWFMLDAIAFWRDKPYSPGQMRFALIAWNVIALGSMPWVWWKASFVVLKSF